MNGMLSPEIVAIRSENERLQATVNELELELADALSQIEQLTRHASNVSMETSWTCTCGESWDIGVGWCKDCESAFPW